MKILNREFTELSKKDSHMNIYYHPKYNISLGVFNRLHPFDGTKYAKVYQAIKHLDGIQIKRPEKAISHKIINEFVEASVAPRLKEKAYILSAIELPQIPLLPLFLIDNRVLSPMRWGVAGTLAASRDALNGLHAWNMSGGYHHASQFGAEGFCIYNDIGISIQQLKKEGLITDQDRFLILDIDAHHGNGNARTFMDDGQIHPPEQVDLLDIYNGQIYPSPQFTKDRLTIDIPVRSGTRGEEYLKRLEEGLNRLKSIYKMAFVIAGTDVIATDPLGQLKLSIEDCVDRDLLVMEKLNSLSIPTVFLGGGGYSAGSAQCIIESIKQLYTF